MSPQATAHPGKSSYFANLRWVPWAIVAAFVVVFAVNGALVYFAAESWPGLLTDDPYTQGNHYNRVIAESQKEAALGWKVAVSFQAAGHATGTVTVEGRDGAGAALEGLQLRGQAIRPVGVEEPPIPLSFRAEGDGRYVAEVRLPLRGQWDLYLVARRSDGAVFHTGRRIIAL